MTPLREIWTVPGIAWLTNSSVFDLFLEYAPSLQITSSTGFGVKYCFQDIGGFG
jgi:hypothetical protein